MITARAGVVAFAAIGLVAGPRFCEAQSPPFQVGERLDYRVTVGRLGDVGTGSMWIDGVVELRGRETMVLQFELRAGKGPVRAHDRTTSWFDASQVSALRFEKSEKHPLSRHAESIEIFPEARKWVDEKGVVGTTETDAPLDELSFLYFLRTMTLDTDSAVRFDRHYDAARNPTTVRVVRRRTLTTPAGQFATVELEMRVRDPRRYRGEGIIRIDLTDDARRLPVRMESSMPVLGRTVLTLTSARVGGERLVDSSGRR
jgi:hypothetical protein